MAFLERSWRTTRTAIHSPKQARILRCAKQYLHSCSCIARSPRNTDGSAGWGAHFRIPSAIQHRAGCSQLPGESQCCITRWPSRDSLRLLLASNVEAVKKQLRARLLWNVLSKICAVAHYKPQDHNRVLLSMFPRQQDWACFYACVDSCVRSNTWLPILQSTQNF